MVGCVADDGAYDPDFDADGVLAGGKADGLLDATPLIEFDGEAEGDVGGDRLELYRIRLQRTDQIEVEMEVLSGDLNPHVTLYYGTSSYVSSDSWERDGDVLRKVYTAESTGTYLIAVRAYREQGEGDYALRVRCVGGVCAGVIPPPDPDELLYPSEVATCIGLVRDCAMARLPAYDGRVGEARSAIIVDECLADAARQDVTCAGVAEWVNPDEDYDRAQDYLDAIASDLPFYADASDACLSVLDTCLSDCMGIDPWSSAETVQDHPEVMCWDGIWNGDCDLYARGHEACGGTRLADSSADCTALCHSTTGAFIDDLDTLCDSDSDCDNYCDVDFGGAATECGAMSPDTADCFRGYLDDTEAYSCDGVLIDRLETFVPRATCDYGFTSQLPPDSTELAAHVTDTDDLTGWLSDLQYQQLVIATTQLELGEAGVDEDTALMAFDEGQAEQLDVEFNSNRFDWVRGYAGDTEVGVIFAAGTVDVVAEVSDGDIVPCM